jgi:hypothetical protein
MNTRNWKNPLVWIVMLLMGSCVEPYFPEVLESPQDFLVVNGYLSANGRTTVQLVRTQSLDATGLPPAERMATVIVESEQGERLGLHEINEGIYSHPNLQLTLGAKYRLYIRTRNGREYASDYVEVLQTPVIGSVDWQPSNDAIDVYVNTRDAANNTRYYRWDFEQTWQFKPALSTTLIYENGRIRYREPSDKQISICWKSEPSTTIELTSTTKLAADVVSNYKLFSIPSRSEKLSIKNSILVKQYALTRDAYQYWEIVKKNTENIGTLFDPLPSQQTGNIRSLTNPGETVIGYVSAGVVQEKRIFIDSRDLPGEWRLFNAVCSSDTMLLHEADIRDYFEGGYVVPVNAIFPPGASMSPIGYTFAPAPCVDCTTQGTNVKPSFWE